MIYHRHYHADYDDATRSLSMLDHGAYRRMLDAYYATEKPFPGTREETGDITRKETREETYRLSGAFSDDERAAVDRVLVEFFTLEPDGCWHNRRADEEIAKANAAIEVARTNGKKGGRPRTQKETQTITQPVTASETIRAVVQPFNRSTELQLPISSRVREALPELAQPVFDEFAERDGDSIARFLQSAHEPISGGARYSWEQIGQGLIDYRARKGKDFVPISFKRFLEENARPAPVRANGNGQTKQETNLTAIAEGVRRVKEAGNGVG